ncbi:MAG: DEAD/DEAH box helicase [Planctomycetes bacterium]|nr:DEAD/DEAH box helicase [Planctomycetota bacterium]
MKSQQSSVPELQRNLTILPGIGSVRATKYQVAFGVSDVEGLLRLLPKRYQPAPLLVNGQDFCDIDGEFVQICGEIYSVSIFRMGYKRNILNVRIKVGEQKLCVAFFNQAFRKNQFVEGEKMAFEGVIVEKNGWQLTSAAVIDEADMSQSQAPRPIYPKGEGLPSKFVGASVAQAVKYAAQLVECLPDDLLDAAQVPMLAEAVRMVHLPDSLDEAELGRRRLALGELYSLNSQRADLQVKTTALECDDEVLQRIFDLLPFELNTEQLHVIEELRADLQSGVCMQRLLHGEVGSGKTAVAFVVALMVVASGGQVAVLAPTEILAHQHYLTFSKWLAKTETTVGHNQTDAHIVLGTHALLGAKIVFDNLRLVVFDEQQRFGVEQKASLVAKGVEPHVLTMTATPIPRTLAWSYYGSLRPCVLEKRAGANAEIVTKVFSDAQIEEQCAKLISFLEKGQQVIIVVPRIDGEDGLLSWHEYLMGGIFKKFSAALVHGRLDADVVQTAVDDFRNKQAQLLFGSTIIEVGIDIPNVQHLLVFDAQRLGLSSLHQLRGRLARGENAVTGYCQLFSDSDESQQRLAVLETCDNGFEVAAADLKQRGPGALLGTKQSGRGGFQSFDPVKDSDLVQLIADFSGNQAAK